MPEPRRAAPTEDPEPAEQENPGESGGDQDASAAGAEPGTHPLPSWRSLLGFGRGQIIVAIVLMLTALTFVLMARSHSSQGVYDNMRREELIQLLDQASSETRRLETEVADLRAVQADLESGAAGVEAAEADARRRLEQLEILAGTVPAAGPGIRLTIHDDEGNVTPELLLNGVEELRDAGAEVLEFNDSIRVTVGSWLAMDEQGRTLLDGQVLDRPIVIEAIGDPATLEAGARFRGGLVSGIEGPQVGGRVEIVQLESLEIESVVEPRAQEYARPR